MAMRKKRPFMTKPMESDRERAQQLVGEAYQLYERLKACGRSDLVRRARLRWLRRLRAFVDCHTPQGKGVDCRL